MSDNTMHLCDHLDAPHVTLCGLSTARVLSRPIGSRASIEDCPACVETLLTIPDWKIQRNQFRVMGDSK